MDIIKHFDNLIGTWDTENKCGECWKFVGAGRPDLFNMFQDVEVAECCIYVALFKIKFGTRYNSIGDGMTKKDYSLVSFEGFIGIPGRLDVQFYNELGDSDQEKEESKWTIINKIKECMGPDFLELLCDSSGLYSPAEFTAEQKINYQDSNYDGWMFKGQYNF